MLDSTIAGEWTLLWSAVLRRDAPQVASHKVLVPLPSQGVAIAGVINPWTRLGADDFLGALFLGPRAAGTVTGTCCLDPDGWLVRILAPGQGKNGTRHRTDRQSESPPTPKTPGFPRDGRGVGC